MFNFRILPMFVMFFCLSLYYGTMVVVGDDSVYVDGKEMSDTDIQQYRGQVTAPGLSPTSGARLYYDIVDHALLLSKEGGAYSQIGTGQQTPWTSDINAAGYQLLNTGNVGIGTTSPSQKLEVVGNSAISGNLSVDTVTARTVTAGDGSSDGVLASGGSHIVINDNVQINGDLSVSTHASPSGAVRIAVIDNSTGLIGASSTNFGQWGTGSGTVSSGVSGRVAYYNATGTTVDDLSVLYYDATNLHISKPVSLSDALSVKGTMWVNSNNIAVANGIQQANASGVPITNGTVNILGNLSGSGVLTATGVMYATNTLKPSAGLTISNTLSGSGATVWYALVIDANGNVKRSAVAWNK